MKQILLTIFALISISSICLSQDATMKVEISNDTILMGNHIQLKYTIENAKGKFEIPELEGMMLIAGPNTSSSMSMVNGVVTQKASYTLYLKPVDIGNHHIGPAYIETEAGLLEAQPINIIVVDNPDGFQQDAYKLKLIEEVLIEAGSVTKKKRAKRFKI